MQPLSGRAARWRTRLRSAGFRNPQDSTVLQATVTSLATAASGRHLAGRGRRGGRAGPIGRSENRSCSSRRNRPTSICVEWPTGNEGDSFILIALEVKEKLTCWRLTREISTKIFGELRNRNQMLSEILKILSCTAPRTSEGRGDRH